MLSASLVLRVSAGGLFEGWPGVTEMGLWNTVRRSDSGGLREPERSSGWTVSGGGGDARRGE